MKLLQNKKQIKLFKIQASIKTKQQQQQQTSVIIFK